MKKDDLTETFVSGEAVFSGKLLHVRRDVVRLPDGSRGVREYIRHPGAVAAVALFEDARVLLVRQFRYPLGRAFLELPAGKRDAGESPLQTAQRELLEETGYEASDWRRLGVIHVAVAYTDEGIELYLARGLRKRREAQLDAGEFLETLEIPFAEALAMVRDGRITDAKSVAGLLWAEAWGAEAPRGEPQE